MITNQRNSPQVKRHQRSLVTVFSPQSSRRRTLHDSNSGIKSSQFLELSYEGLENNNEVNQVLKKRRNTRNSKIKSMYSYMQMTESGTNESVYDEY